MSAMKARSHRQRHTESCQQGVAGDPALRPPPAPAKEAATDAK